MASEGKYMAYVGSYSYNGKAKGITVYDVDVEKGTFKERCEVEVDNSSYVTASNDNRTLYSVADEGVVAFRILENGSLSRLNSAKTKGMRACHLSMDKEDRYVFVSGFHDGKATVLRLRKDGGVGEIVDGVFHKGLGSVAERNFRPHVTCCRRTPDNKYVMIVDSGLDQVKGRLRDLFELRRVFEPQVARLACHRASEGEMEEILRRGAEVERCIRAGEDRTRADREFHAAIVRSTHNEFMMRLMPLISEAVAAAITSGHTEQLAEDTLRDHALLMDFLRKRDESGCEHAMAIHMHHSMDVMGLEE